MRLRLIPLLLWFSRSALLSLLRRQWSRSRLCLPSTRRCSRVSPASRLTSAHVSRSPPPPDTMTSFECSSRTSPTLPQVTRTTVVTEVPPRVVLRSSLVFGVQDFLGWMIPGLLALFLHNNMVPLWGGPSFGMDQCNEWSPQPTGAPPLACACLHFLLLSSFLHQE
ncbi:hypothetical protein M3J07_001268 [Ascochyta lentis]